MTVKTLNDLFIHDLADIYSAEKQIARALPKMARAASDENLVVAFIQHLEETRGQIERLGEFVEVTPEVKIKRMKCHALEGLAEEAQEIIESVEKGEVRVKGLIAAAQKVEHYEIATYGTLQALALKPGYTKAAKLLALTLEEEKQTDVKLTTLAQAISTVEGATK
ncbi:YciE/YciF ferroxidase family protein [Pantoea ananatis]|uniref:YciE/YciF ferroxidase family protein n=1 Tax=Pantoea ananas TaxID=553 RepID=UPI0021F762EA|nr:ferritin-like domain-containing protein [Pantoea ananatis]MCW0331244.1 Protein YciF [Pantoea ananatis]